mmetsp:Transcript_17176/g.58315  ORF Transcript_17176/g.58315 Transcript_17176/m.58315 type:complete len:689 (-) Transcript_17176:48-2114(-)
MATYNWKTLTPIPTNEDFIDVVLTRTQRRTPTVVHPGFKISRIRKFYMRKVKFTEQTISERLGLIISQFPRLDDVHPFYADLMNVLYDRDHYKLALGQVNTAKNICSTLSRDYVRLLKYAETLYACKQLKVAALGRMCTVLKKLKASFGYLEEVRKHISRLPALDPTARTLLLTGFPNVGKSSFMNKITRADVEVQPYAFTTKSLFVGHLDHRYLRWQVVDTPGILDRPLEERSTIEMTAITALAHLQCAVLYFVDVSEQCGYTIEQQVALFNSIRPLFINKQVFLVCNKIDVIRFEDVRPDARALLESLTEGPQGVPLLTMSNTSEENVSVVKNTACDALLEARVEAKTSSSGGRRIADVMSRVTVALPRPRDALQRGACIPETVAAARGADGAGAGAGGDQEGGAAPMRAERVTERDLMWQHGGPGVYSVDYRKYYLLDEDEWKYDAIPHIMDGKNVADFVDPDIEQKLARLEEEEAMLAEQYAAELAEYRDEESDVDDDDVALAEAVRDARDRARHASQQARVRNHSRVTARQRAGAMTGEDVAAHLESKGLESEAVVERMQERGRKRHRSLSRGREASRSRGGAAGDDEGEGPGAAAMTVEGEESGAAKRARRERSRSRSRSRGAARGESVAPQQRTEVSKAEKSVQRIIRRDARKGEADRHVSVKLVKHLVAGKSGLGTRRWR